MLESEAIPEGMDSSSCSCWMASIQGASVIETEIAQNKINDSV
jgi:hypothetical protein